MDNFTDGLRIILPMAYGSHKEPFFAGQLC